MRKSLILIILILIARVALAQDIFTVVKVNGNIIVERTGSPLNTGSSFAQNENLLFKVPDSRALVSNPKRGRLLLTSQNFAEFRSSKSNYLPPASKIAMRALNPGSSSDALKVRFDGAVAILDRNRILIDTMTFPMAARKYFYLTYSYDNRTINKKLDFKKDTLIINRNELLTVGGKIIDGTGINQIDLMYIKEGVTNGLTRISTFKPVFPDNTILTTEVGIILDQMELNPYNDKLREVSSFLNEFYGKVDDNTVKIWLSTAFSIKP